MTLVTPTPSAEIAKRWKGLLLVPLTVAAACEGLSTRSLISKVTGLSPAHISHTGFNVKGARRLQRIRETSLKVSRQDLSSKGYSAAEIKDVLSACPETPLAGFVFRMGQAASAPLSDSMTFGARVDRLAFDSVECIQRNAIEKYKQLLANFLLEEAQLYTRKELRQELEDLCVAVLTAPDWQALTEPSSKATQYALLAVLSAVDVDWGARYLAKLKPVPTFLWLQPRFHSDFDPTNSRGLKRAVVARPVRHLLELLWTVGKRATQRIEWPSEPPGPAVLARDIGHVPTDDLIIRKWVSGAKPIRFDQAVEVWSNLTMNLLGGEAYEVPVPWISLALWMERVLIQRKPRSSLASTVLILSHESYGHIWEGHRARWADRLHKPGTLPWPDWLLAQSSQPDWMRSSQSSGRSSSPGDYQ